MVGLDDLSTGRLENLRAVSDHPSFRLVEGSILDSAAVAELTAGVDWVFHLAAAVGAFVIRDRTLSSLRTNIRGTENVVEAAHRNGARLLVASTSEIYGKNTKIGLREDDDRIIGSPLKSRWSYSEAKAIDESLVEGYVRELGLKAVIVRFFNTVGPRQTGRYGMVIPRFVQQALAGQPLTVFGTGHQIRCFCHVHDVVPALTRLITSDRASGLAVNLGSTEQVTIEGLAERVIAATGSPQRDRAHLVPGGIRLWLRGHAAPGTGLRAGRGAGRLPGHAQPGRHHPGRDRGPAGPADHGGCRELRAGRADENRNNENDGGDNEDGTQRQPGTGDGAEEAAAHLRRCRVAGCCPDRSRRSGTDDGDLAGKQHTAAHAGGGVDAVLEHRSRHVGRARPPACRHGGVALDVRAEQLGPDRHPVRRGPGRLGGR